MGRVIDCPALGQAARFCFTAYLTASLVACGDNEAVTTEHSAPVTTAREEQPLDTSVSLIDHQRWQLLSAEDNPFWVANDERIPCGESDVEFNADNVEINTNRCNHATLSQPLLRTVEAGAQLELGLWWQPLVSETQATAHLGLSIGDVNLLHLELEIPGPADVFESESESTARLPQGTPVYFHVNNHGINSYTLHRVAVRP